MDLRKIALITCVTGVAELLVVGWDKLPSLLSMAFAHAQWWVIPALPVMLLFGSAMPIFYFALYDDPGRMRFPTLLRKLALIAAVTEVGIFLLRFHPSSVVLSGRFFLGVIADLAYLLLLLTMSREAPDDVSEQPTPSEFLQFVTRVTVLLWGAWVAFQLVRFPIAVYLHSYAERLAFQKGRAAPPLQDALGEVVFTFLSQACLLAAPFIVWRSGFGRRRVN
jgi:hypothetical protein